MDYVKPADLAVAMVDTGLRKLALRPIDLLIRGALAGALLGTATSLAFTATMTTGQPIVGAIIFPIGLVMIVLFGLELVTGSFSLVALPWLDGRARLGAVLANWGWVFAGNLIGAVMYGVMLVATLTMSGSIAPIGIAKAIMAVAALKTHAYAAHGAAGLLTAFIRGMLCNWLVCAAVVMAMTSTSTIGKVVTAWLPITVFFAQGFEHSVVNMFLIPTAMLLGAKISFADWWLWNQIPVTLGNIVGGFVFTGAALYVTYRPRGAAAPALAAGQAAE